MQYLSNVQKTIRNKKDYHEVTFHSLLEKQRHSRRGATISQLGVDGVGYVCLRNNVDFDLNLKQTFETSLKKSNMKLFRTEHADSEDTRRLQLVTTYGNALEELTIINEKKTVDTQVVVTYVYKRKVNPVCSNIKIILSLSSI